MGFWKDVGKAFACGAAGVVGSVFMQKALRKLDEPETKEKTKNIFGKPIEQKTSKDEKTEAE